MAKTKSEKSGAMTVEEASRSLEFVEDHLATIIEAENKGHLNRNATSAELAKLQRRLVLLARDASNLACALYGAIRMAESEEVLRGNESVGSNGS